jgi:hypothetical protein
MSGSCQFLMGCVLVMAGCASTDGPNASETQFDEAEQFQQAELNDEKRNSDTDLALMTEVKPETGAEVSVTGVITENSDEALPAPDSDSGDGGQTAVRDPLVDRTQQALYDVVNNSAHWFDGFFGTAEIDQGSNVSRGRLTLGSHWDERDGIDFKLRFKARIPLPALENRTRLVFGRGDADDFVDGTESEEFDALPGQFSDFEDDDWLLGVGYSRNGQFSKGFDFSVGMKLATPLEPYVRATYRWNRALSSNWLWRLRPQVFWQNQRGVGTSVNSILDYAVNSSWLLRTWTNLQVEDEVEGLAWSNNFTAYQSLTNRKAMSYTLFASGETEHEVEIQNVGFELRFRRRISREYLFVILSTSLSWPREFIEEKRESNIGVGIELEMQFGDWPGRKQLRRPGNSPGPGNKPAE